MIYDKSQKPDEWGLDPGLTESLFWDYDPIVIPYWERGGDPKTLDYRGLTGTRTGTVPWTDTAAGAGLTLDGNTSNYFDFGDVTDLQFTETTSFTFLSVFVLVDTAAYREILSKDSGAGTRSLWQWRVTNADNLELLFGRTSFTLGTIVSNATLGGGTVYAVAGVRDVAADQLRLFINGVKDNEVTDPSTGTWTVSTGTVRTQLSGGGSPAPFNGDKILDVIFPFNALTDQEAIDLTIDPFQMIRSANIIPTGTFVPVVAGGPTPGSLGLMGVGI